MGELDAAARENLVRGLTQVIGVATSFRYGFGVERDSRNFDTGAFDKMLAVSFDNVHFAMVKHIEEHGIADGMQYLRWRPLADALVETVTVPTLAGHIRAHRIETGTPLHLAEGGFTLPVRAQLGQNADPGRNAAARR